MNKKSNSPVSTSGSEQTGGTNSEPGDNPTPLSASAANVGSLADQLIAEAPEPQPHAIQQASDERAETAATSVDANGIQFDPNQHTGTKTANGSWRRKAGRKSGGTNAAAGSAKPKLNLPGGGGEGPSGNEAKIAAARASGQGVANLFLMLSVGIGGEEWQPREKPINEKEMLEQGFADYFQSQGWEDLPPGLALIACVGVYALPRFAMPRTKERAKGFKNWAVGKYIDWKAGRAKKKHARQFGPESTVETADRRSREAYARERENLARAEAEGKLI